MKKKPLIVLTGPTAVGKTDLSIKLAKQINGEIISADSMQVYKYMDIGSAKIMPEEADGVTHHLIDVLLPSEECNVVVFQKMAKECVEKIYNKGKIPIVVGGTGFYIQALLYDIDFEEEEEQTEYRNHLEQLAKEHGNVYLHEKLKEIDPISADEIHANNCKRIIRALEFYEKNGFPISEHNKMQKQKNPAYQACYFVLNDAREKIYERIDKRVDVMLEKGLVEEVKCLKKMGYHKGMVSMQGLGYKEILAYLDDEISLEEAVYLIKRDSRRFAKRQLTWFRRERDVIWVDKQEFLYKDSAILDFMLECLNEKGII